MNTFGSTNLQFALCDPRAVREARRRFRRDTVPDLAKANSFCCPVGHAASRGWVLLPRYEYTRLDSYSTVLQLIAGKLTFKNLSVVQAQCVSRGVLSDRNALYLVELTDGRGVLDNRWFQFPVNAQYNVRSPAYPQQYYSGSMNGGVAWTWSTMIGDLWSRMSAFLGTYPGLPNTPSGTPEGWIFLGEPAWQAMCGILDQLGLTVACNPANASPYTVVSAAAADATFTSLQATYAPNLEDDLEWLDTGSGRTPKTVVVYFPLRTEYYGQEETVRRDSLQWTSTPLYSVSVATSYTAAAGTHSLRDDFTVRQDLDGNLNAADVATAATIAAERVSQYVAKMPNFMMQVYAGALPFYAGSQVDCVQWKQNFSDQEREGWRTIVIRGAYEPA